MEQPDGRYVGPDAGWDRSDGADATPDGSAGRMGGAVRKWKMGGAGWMDDVPIRRSANPPVRPPTVVPAGHSAVRDQSCHPTNGSCNLQTGNYTVFIAQEIDHEQSLW